MQNGMLAVQIRAGYKHVSVFAAWWHSTVCMDSLVCVSHLVLQVHIDGVTAAHARLAPAARHHCGVAGHAPARREDALGCVHATHVLGGGLLSHQDHKLTLQCGAAQRRDSKTVKYNAVKCNAVVWQGGADKVDFTLFTL